ncbi:prepilin peptidase-dependent protein [Candidatus Fukatsuia symbiotica]|nr:prepilin peptidase-dependent protein [Candidatus Fukatsuia symbiotica]MEA9445152.1 prepilin peptidase-dependent protein [Candidatus Fukatsuia symbiotica]
MIEKKSDCIQIHHYHPPMGFTLPEVMLALSFGSLIVLSAAKIYPQFHKQVATVYQHYRLEQAMRQVMLTIEKDVRRAGFCHQQCSGSAIAFSQDRGEMKNSCMIVAYDLNRNGHWEDEGHTKSEYFGYRLRHGALEAQRGERNCFGNGWEKLFDPQEIKVTHFTVTPVGDLTSGNLFKLQLAANSIRDPAVQLEINSVIHGKNL